MVETKLLLELLMRLLADPPGFDRSGESFEAHIGRQVRHIVFLLACRPTFSDEPDLVPRHALQSVIAGCDTSEVLQPIESGLDAPAQLVEARAEAKQLLPV